jgi:hypothetical protein
MELLWLFAAVFIFLFVGRAARTFLDHRRIRRHFGEVGGEVLDITWGPFRSSWVSFRRDDVYAVTFTNPEGMRQTVYCRTGPLEGVFLAEQPPEPLTMDLQTPGRLVAAKRRRARKASQDPGPTASPPTTDGEGPSST